MAWTIEVSRTAERQLGKLDRHIAARLLDYLEERVATAVDPRTLGKALQGNLHGTWRYRVGDYRLICKIEDQRITIVVVAIGHRRDIYS